MKRNLQRWIKPSLIILILLVVFLLAIRDQKKGYIVDSNRFYAYADNIRVNAYKANDKQYLFFPGFAKENEIRLSHSLQDVPVEMMYSSDIPAIFISTQSGDLEQIYGDKEYKETGIITAYNSDGSINYSGGLEYIKGHGNYSWYTEVWTKKPFGISLDKDESLFNLPSGKKYVLIANASDPTLVRNDIARSMEVTLGIPFSHTGVFVDLYINNDYIGNYYLCDTIEISETRININPLEAQMNSIYYKSNYSAFDTFDDGIHKAKFLPTIPDDISGGYLIEREFEDRYRLEYDKIHSGFITDSGECFIVHSPTYCSIEEIMYIADYINNVDRSISSGESYCSYIDLNSFAMRYLVEEVTLNYDSGNSSSYYYKLSDTDGGLLYAGPGWDYDISLGNYYEWIHNQSPTGISRGIMSDGSNDWYPRLYNQSDFRSLYITAYNDSLSPFCEYLVDYGIDEYRTLLKSSYKMDSIRWADMYESCGYTVGSDESFDILRDFISKRNDYLTSLWSN